MLRTNNASNTKPKRPDRIDITGQRFGYLVTTGLSRSTYSPSTRRGRTEWLVQCDCGEEKWLDGWKLRKGLLKSCGCRRKADAAAIARAALARKMKEKGHQGLPQLGARFGKWSVISCEPIYARGSHPKWMVRCDCGTERAVFRNSLKHGASKSCGRCEKETRAPMPGWRRSDGLPLSGAKWSSIRNGAQSRGIPFEIDRKWAYQLFVEQGKRCALTGVEIGFGSQEKPEITASLDRIDSSGPYSAENVQWVHKTINVMKLDLTQHQFIEMCRRVAEWNAAPTPKPH